MRRRGRWPAQFSTLHARIIFGAPSRPRLLRLGWEPRNSTGGVQLTGGVPHPGRAVCGLGGHHSTQPAAGPHLCSPFMPNRRSSRAAKRRSGRITANADVSDSLSNVACAPAVAREGDSRMGEANLHLASFASNFPVLCILTAGAHMLRTNASSRLGRAHPPRSQWRRET